MGAIANVQASRDLDPRRFQACRFPRAGPRDQPRRPFRSPLVFRGEEFRTESIAARNAACRGNDGVTGVVAAGETGGVSRKSGEVINHLALAFVSPLSADHNYCFRVRHDLS